MSEFNNLTPEQKTAVGTAIRAAKERQERVSVTTTSGDEVYASPNAGKYAWGVNSGETGCNIARGISP